MKKRRASSDLQSAKKKDSLDDRRVEFAQTLRALNSQFCEWVQEQNREKPAELWSEGVEDYLTHTKELLSEFADVIDEEDEGKQEGAEDAAGASAPSSSANGFGSAFGLAPSVQSSEGFGKGGGGGGGFNFSTKASQPAGSSAHAGASQPQQQQATSSVADFLKGIPTPAPQALSGLSSLGSGKLPPVPAFNFSNGGKNTAAGGSGGGDGGLGGGRAAASSANAPPLFNFSTVFGGGSSTLPASGPASTSSPAAQSPPASNPFGFGGTTGFTSSAAAPGSGPTAASTSSSVFGSKAPAFGGGGFSFGAPTSAASSAPASSGATMSLLPASNTIATSGAPAASASLFSVAHTQPLPSLFSFATGNAGTGGAAMSAPAQNGANENDNADAPDENPEDKVKVQLDDSAADILYRDNAKLYFQDKVTKKWEDRGRGNLTLRRAKQQPGDSGPNTPFLVFTMESGRVLLNASLYKGLSMQQQKAMVLMTLEVADAPGSDDGAAKPAMTLVNFRLRSAEEGKSFHDKIKEHVPS